MTNERGAEAELDHTPDDTGQTRGGDGGDLDVLDAIYTTRSMRRLRPDAVPEWVIWEILDAAIRGPSSGNVQRWGWIVVSDQEVQDRIASWYLDAWNSLGGGRRERLKHLVKHVWLSRLQPAQAQRDKASADLNDASGDHLANNLARAPVWIIVTQSGVRGEPGLVDGADVYGAVQNLMLAARKFGLGSTLTMLHRHREHDVARLLGLPADTVTVALIPIGYPERNFSTPQRRPVEDVTHWGRWGERRRRPARPDGPGTAASA